MQSAQRYDPRRFFLLAFAFSWVPFLVAALAGFSQGASFLLNLVGLLGPTVAAVVLVFGSNDPVLKNDFKDRLTNVRRIRPIYLVPVFAMPLGVVLLSIWMSTLIGESRDQFAFVGDPGNILPLIIIATILAPLIEETGWRGYGVDSLRAHMAPLAASLSFGILWSLWHAPLFLIPGTYQNQMAHMSLFYVANFFLSVIPLAVVANWLFYKHDRSIIAGILFHSMVNTAAVFVNAGQPAKCMVTVVYGAIAAAIVAIDRKAFSGGPRCFVAD